MKTSIKTYTLDDKFLENATDVYITDVLFVIANRSNNCKITLDKNDVIENIYWDIAEKNEMIRFWLNQMLNFKPEPFHYVVVEFKKELSLHEVFLELCKSTIGRKELITYSKYDYNINDFADNGEYIYDSKFIKIHDKDEAIVDLNKSCCTTIREVHMTDSVYIDGSSIDNSFNKTKDND